MLTPNSEGYTTNLRDFQLGDEEGVKRDRRRGKIKTCTSRDARSAHGGMNVNQLLDHAVSHCQGWNREEVFL